jgi:hypothetical protein
MIIAIATPVRNWHSAPFRLTGSDGVLTGSRLRKCYNANVTSGMTGISSVKTERGKFAAKTPKIGPNLALTVKYKSTARHPVSRGKSLL